MHLEPTGPHQTPLTSIWRQRLMTVIVAIMIVVSLVGCAEGTARDAERGRARDADATSVVDTLQSTRTSELINSSPEASATP